MVIGYSGDTRALLRSTANRYTKRIVKLIEEIYHRVIDERAHGINMIPSVTADDAANAPLIRF